MQAAPDAPHDGCSDEGVPIIALLLSQEDPSQDVWADLERLGVIPECTTFVGWRHCFANTVFNLDKPIIHDVKAILEEVTFDDILHPNKKGNDEGFMNKLKHKLNGFPTYFDQVELDYLASLTEHGFLFGRKFNRGASVTEKGRGEQPLTEVLPLLWEHTDRDPEHSHALRWRTLDAAGAPPVSATTSWVGRNLRRARNAVFGDRRWRPDYLTQRNPLAFHLVAQNWRQSVRQRVHDDQITWTTEDNELQ